VLKIPESFFEARPHFQCLKNVHNEDLTMTAKKRTDSIFSIRTNSNFNLSPNLKPRDVHITNSPPTRHRTFHFDQELPEEKIIANAHPSGSKNVSSII
jgi:hypothetical protein